VPNKGFVNLLRAFAKLKKSHKEATLVIIGDGPQQTELESLVAELLLGDRVVLTGKLNRDVLAAYIQAADLYVLNTAHEGLSHQLLEAMSLKTPIATTPVGGNPELIEDGISGLMFSYNDEVAMLTAMQKIITEPTLGEQLATVAAKKTIQFTAEQSVSETHTALSAVVQK
jgi:glycosyltransferase involved in cell wall biosynthesis